MVDGSGLTLRNWILFVISDPNVAFVLAVLGALAIYLELTHPGRVIPGAIGALLFLVGLRAMYAHPIDWRGAALILLSGPLFFLEARFRTNMIVGTCGAITMAAGAMLLIDSRVSQLRIYWPTAVCTAIPFSASTVYVLMAAMQARRNKRVTD
jgi:membrane-bound serine protease (ClpP class)